MIVKKPINLELTINSGQTSQPPWKFENDTYSDVISVDSKVKILYVTQEDNFIKTNSKEAIEIFDLDFNLDKFYKYLANYDELKDMARFCDGLRIFHAKDPFECIISSISSANNSIKRWTSSITQIKENWGLKVDDYHTFPDYSKNIDEASLKKCGLGYRSSYIKKTFNIINENPEILDIGDMKYLEAFETVLKLPGVGPKVADCILLYGFGFKEAFPSDVWIKRIVSHLYFNGNDISVDKVRNFGMEEFGDKAGYVQLYMFHYARKSGLMSKLK